MVFYSNRMVHLFEEKNKLQIGESDLFGKKINYKLEVRFVFFNFLFFIIKIGRSDFNIKFFFYFRNHKSDRPICDCLFKKKIKQTNRCLQFVHPISM
ncbi:uncharacterized protein DS421_11g350180 [Arachis hypogaea]|nr:uncharacterized protein DS421_11g350180 [Arachis hypogaea]